MGLLQSIGFGGTPAASTTTIELPDVFPMALGLESFVKLDIETIYKRILTEVLERTHGLKDEQVKHLSDSCLATESREGLVTMLAVAMRTKGELFLVYDKATDLVTKATREEEDKIKAAVKSGAKDPGGAYISFKNYSLSDIMVVYSNFEYFAISGLHKNMNLSKALQMKFSDLRASVGAADASALVAQAQAISDSLNKGTAVALDAKDSLELATPSMDATNAATAFIAQKRSFYLGLPASWITGLAQKGLGDSGEGDAKAVERGLKSYYFSIIKPVVETLFGVQTTFKTEDFYGLTTALEVVKTFDLVSDEYVSAEDKKSIANRVFNLQEKAK